MAEEKTVKEEMANDDGSVETLSHQLKWEAMFEKLVEFKKQRGHCLVPNRYKEDQKLGSWVSTQRRQYKAFKAGRINITTLSMDRIEKLESIGFVWSTEDPRRVDWFVRFKQLCSFEKEWGHTLVPIGYKPNPSLGNWVSVQRQEFKNIQNGKPSKLNHTRAKLLESIGFVWKAPRGARRKCTKIPPLQSVAHNKFTSSEQNPNWTLKENLKYLSSHELNNALLQRQGIGALGNINSQASNRALAVASSLHDPFGNTSRLSSAIQLATGVPANNSADPIQSLVSQRATLQYKKQLFQLLDPQYGMYNRQDTSPTNVNTDIPSLGEIMLPSAVNYNSAAADLSRASALQIAAAREATKGPTILRPLPQNTLSPAAAFLGASSNIYLDAMTNTNQSEVSSALEACLSVEKSRLI